LPLDLGWKKKSLRYHVHQHEIRRQIDRNNLLNVIHTEHTLQPVKFIPSYLPTDFPQVDEEPEDEALLTSGGGHYEMPYPLEKDEGEEEDAWVCLYHMYMYIYHEWW